MQGQECRACYWGINNKALSSSNTHIRIDCYLHFAFSCLWLLLHNSRDCTAKWIGLSSNWYAANVLKYLCSNRFCILVCLVSTEVGEGSFPLAYIEEPKANVPLIFLAVMLQLELHSKFRGTIHFIFRSLCSRRGKRTWQNQLWQAEGERRRLKCWICKSLKLMILKFTLLRFKLLNIFFSTMEQCKAEERS